MMLIYKKILCCLLITIMFVIPVYADDSIIVVIDGKIVSLLEQPIIKDGQVFVHSTAIFDSLGYSVKFDNTSYIYTNDINTVVIIPGQTTFTTNGKIHNLTQIIDGDLYMPLHPVLESVGCGVDWQENNRKVLIFSGFKSNTVSVNVLTNPNPYVAPASFSVNTTPVSATSSGNGQNTFSQSSGSGTSSDPSSGDTLIQSFNKGYKQYNGKLMTYDEAMSEYLKLLQIYELKMLQYERNTSPYKRIPSKPSEPRRGALGFTWDDRGYAHDFDD